MEVIKEGFDRGNDIGLYLTGMEGYRGIYCFAEYVNTWIDDCRGPRHDTKEW